MWQCLRGRLTLVCARRSSSHLCDSVSALKATNERRERPHQRQARGLNGAAASGAIKQLHVHAPPDWRGIEIEYVGSVVGMPVEVRVPTSVIPFSCKEGTHALVFGLASMLVHLLVPSSLVSLSLASLTLALAGAHAAGPPRPRPAKIAAGPARRAAPPPTARSERGPSPSPPAGLFARHTDPSARRTGRGAVVE